MPDKQPTDGYLMKLSDDDVEGHVFLKAVEDDDDVEGHSRNKHKAIEDEADVEGHSRNKHKAIEDEADVEGHAMQFRGPTSRGE